MYVVRSAGSPDLVGWYIELRAVGKIRDMYLQPQSILGYGAPVNSPYIVHTYMNLLFAHSMAAPR